MKIRRRVAWLVVIVVVVSSVIVVWESVRNPHKTLSGRIQVGATAPDFAATTVNGEKVRLSDYKGKKILLNFWASWCKPCVQEMPLLNEIHLASGSQVETLFINVGESKGTVLEYLKDHQFSFPASIDVTGKISTAFGVTALPATFIINEEGSIRNIILGEIDDFTLLQQWLKEAGINK
ncbi:redoxin domain-containing protein [Paenibacillus sp. sgz500958]|uniref:redoxin domain-containing protein n=1 Tax=Paenibacillus sp. sgz500958 TaxID=3242475 RepID=UPI0036D3DBD7